MSDPKYVFRGGDVWHQDGYMVPRDEPLMILRGKDIGALVAIVEYVEMLEAQPANGCISSHLSSSIERLGVFYDYQVQNKELKSVGCSRRSHSNPTLFLEVAKRLLMRHGQLD